MPIWCMRRQSLQPQFTLYFSFPERKVTKEAGRKGEFPLTEIPPFMSALIFSKSHHNLNLGLWYCGGCVSINLGLGFYSQDIRQRGRPPFANPPSTLLSNIFTPILILVRLAKRGFNHLKNKRPSHGGVPQWGDRRNKASLFLHCADPIFGVLLLLLFVAHCAMYKPRKV